MTPDRLLETQDCPVCGRKLTEPPSVRGRGGFDGAYFTCARCGQFGLTRTAEANLRVWLQESWDNKMVLSHLLRRMQQSGRWPLIDSKLIENIIKTSALPRVHEQADNLVRWLGDNQRGPGEPERVREETHGGIIGTLTGGGFDFVLRGLVDGRLIKAERTLADGADVELTFDGWRRWDELRQGATNETKAFMAMPYGNAALDKIVDEHFRQAVRDTGFRLIRFDDEPKAGPMDDRMRVEIQSSRFLIADLTDGNNGAYWEAGYAEGLRKPVIYTCEKKTWDKVKTHFDTNHCLHIVWNESAPEEAMKRLKATIRVSVPEARREDE
jgi:hypothetical protein